MFLPHSRNLRTLRTLRNLRTFDSVGIIACVAYVKIVLIGNGVVQIGKTIADVGEFGLIQSITHDLIYRPELVKLGAGDDGAVYTVPTGYDQVISTDTMVEGIHFLEKTMHPYDVGYKLCASNFSDMAAMGAEPIGFVISAALPASLSCDWVELCYMGIRHCCEEYRVNLLGGDVTGSPKGIILTGTVVGMVPEDQAVKRSGAKVGDLVFVTGTIGDSAAGLAALMKGNAREYPLLVSHHRRPKPQIALGTLLREAGASSLNDISDGLSREANEIAKASGVVLEIVEDKIPLCLETKWLGKELRKNPYLWAWNGGEDYQLVGTISLENYEKVRDNKDITLIGQVVEASDTPGVYAVSHGKKVKVAAHGYDHFNK